MPRRSRSCRSTYITARDADLKRVLDIERLLEVIGVHDAHDSLSRRPRFFVECELFHTPLCPKSLFFEAIDPDHSSDAPEVPAIEKNGRALASNTKCNNTYALLDHQPKEDRTRLMVKRHRIVSLVVGLQSLSPAFRYLRGSQRRTPTRSTTFFSNQCLQPINDTGQGAAIVQEPCNGGAAQQWTEVSVGSNVFHYVNVLSGLCLDARGGAVNGTPVQQWSCNSISNEKWQPGEDVSDEIPPLISRVSGKQLLPRHTRGSGSAGLAMQIYRCNGTLAQQWWFPE